MNLQEIKELMQTMAQTGVTSLDWNSCGAAIHLERQSASAHDCCGSHGDQTIGAAGIMMPGAQIATESGVPIEDAATGSAARTELAVSEEISLEDKPGEIVKSPVVGIYYSSPSPDNDSFVRHGSRIEKGDPLCIIEAMKLMNEVSSPCSGEIAEILVENGQRVEYGQPLFRIV
ncbi:MAG: acetyl-CoA carboxylase biotin carboxyl carrier protein [Clostridiaceae bacterium]|nr:acetyl-CoA carboxylase biotin carboxyl carrier protein [Clostridiaceae bacterium]